MEDYEIENKILEILSPFNPKWSNQVFREFSALGKFPVSKGRYHRLRDEMIKQEWIKVEKKGQKLLLTRLNFEATKFEEGDWTKITRMNCDNWLEYFKDNKPLFRVRMNKPFKIKKEIKIWLDAFFHELDRQMIVCIRLVNAEALGLITSTRAKTHQKKCIDFVKEYVKKLLNDHKEFKEEIREYAQSQLRTVQFKI